MGIINAIKIQEETLETAREIKKDKFSAEKIAKLTKLSVKKIKNL